MPGEIEIKFESTHLPRSILPNLHPGSEWFYISVAMLLLLLCSRFKRHEIVLAGIECRMCWEDQSLARLEVSIQGINNNMSSYIKIKALVWSFVE